MRSSVCNLAVMHMATMLNCQVMFDELNVQLCCLYWQIPQTNMIMRVIGR